MLSASLLSDIPANQDFIISLMLKQKYNSNKKGVCHPVSIVAMFEIFTHDIKGFDSYIKDIFDLSINDEFNISNENKIKISALFHFIDLFYSSRKFGTDKTLSNYDLIQMKMPDSLKNNEICFFEMVREVHNHESLNHYLSMLRKIVFCSPNLSEPPAILLESDTHAICIGYDKIENNWIFVNANQLSERYFACDDALAKHIIAGFFSEDGVSFASNFYCLKNDFQELAKIFQSDEMRDGILDNRSLLQKQEIKFTDSNLYHASITIVGKGHLNLLKMITPSLLDDRGRSFLPMLLYYAVDRRQYDIVDYLLSGKLVKANATFKNVLIPIHAATRNNDTKMMQLLLYYGADLFKTNKKGEDAELIAIKSKHTNALTVINEYKFYKIYKFHHGYEFDFSIVNSDLSKIASLLNQGYKIYTTNHDGQSAWDIAVKLNNAEVIALLKPKMIELVADLYKAVCNEQVKVVKDILKLRFDLRQTPFQTIIFRSAVRRDNQEIIKILLEAGFNPYKKISRLLSGAFQYAGELNKTNTRAAILQHDAHNPAAKRYHS